MAQSRRSEPLVGRHHRWQKRPPSIQSSAGERSLKARRHCFVPLVRVSGEKVRMATLFRVSHPDTWGENPDERRFFCISSGFLGRFPGRVSLLHTPWKDYGQKVTEVYRKTSSKHRFWIPLGNKTGKIRSRCFPACKQAGTNQNASRCAIPAGGSQNVLRYAIPISTSQGRFCHRWCSQLKKPLVGIFARGDVL